MALGTAECAKGGATFARRGLGSKGDGELDMNRPLSPFLVNSYFKVHLGAISKFVAKMTFLTVAKLKLL